MGRFSLENPLENSLRGSCSFCGSSGESLAISAIVRSQEKGVLAKGVSGEPSVTPRRRKNIKDIGPSIAFGAQSATSKRGVHSCKNPLLKIPFSLFLRLCDFAVREAANKAYLDKIEKWMKDHVRGPFVLGSSISIADVKVVPYFYSVMQPAVKTNARFTPPPKMEKYVNDIMQKARETKST